VRQRPAAWPKSLRNVANMQVTDEKAQLLKQGDVGSWNAWRFSDLSMRPSLQGVDLSGAVLPGVAFWRMQLGNCILNGARLQNADLRESDFSGTSFENADLRGAAAWGSNFSGCDLRGARLDSANFEASDRSGATPERLGSSTSHARSWYVLPPWHSRRRPCPPAPPEGHIVIALLGDCTVYTGYLPPSERPCATLAKRLAGSDSCIPVFVYDLSDDGETVAGLLQRYERDILAVPRIDVAFIRYGITDRKEYGAERFVELLGRLCLKLEKDFPGIQPVIETGMHVDYPHHYPFDRNAKLAPLYEKAKQFASERDYPVVDVYSELERRTAEGDWDWRIRGLGIGTPSSLHDDGQDHLHKDDPDWFFNIHPNSRCIGLIAQMERDVFTDLRDRRRLCVG